MKLHHIAIKTGNPLRLSRFYEKIIKLKKIKTIYDNKKIRSIWFSTEDGVIIMLEKTNDRSCNAHNGFFLISFAIPVFERNEKKLFLKKKKVSVTSETSFSIYFNDPDGNRLAFSHYPDAWTEL